MRSFNLMPRALYCQRPIVCDCNDAAATFCCRCFVIISFLFFTFPIARSLALLMTVHFLSFCCCCWFYAQSVSLSTNFHFGHLSLTPRFSIRDIHRFYVCPQHRPSPSKTGRFVRTQFALKSSHAASIRWKIFSIYASHSPFRVESHQSSADRAIHARSNCAESSWA